MDVVFKYQSQSIGFSEWLSLLTLAFAPLVAHIFVGVMEPTVLNGEISWKQQICHYNPTSIIWRYLAITDRRCRAREWTQLDMAATNAVFWNRKHWDGSLEIMNEKKDLATKFPSSNRVSLASVSVLQTLIISLQGIQAVYTVIIHAMGKEAVPGHPISHVFFPLAIIGLLRLPAALWLTQEYGFPQGEDKGPQGGDDGDVELRNLLQQEQRPASVDDLLNEQFYPRNSWRGIAVRIGFLGTLLLLTVVVIIVVAVHFGPGTEVAVSSLLTAVYYLFFLVCTIFTFSIYIWTKKSDTTVIPCIESPVYKAYTYGLILLSIVYVVVTALETRRTSCGLYTTSYIEWGEDESMCKSYQAF